MGTHGSERLHVDCGGTEEGAGFQFLGEEGGKI